MREWVNDKPSSGRSGDRDADMRRNSETYADRRRKAGWRRVAVWVPEDRVDDLRAFVDEIGQGRIPPKPRHPLDSRWKQQAGSASKPALNELLAGITPENMHDPIDLGAPIGKEAL